jgi:HPt (histidine-containing phosphotransfer) domain-containing protein
MLIEKKRALREINISEEMFDELLNVFIEQTEPALKILEETAERKNYEEMRKKAHLISGSAGNLRISGIQKLAKAIEAGAMEKKDITGIKIHIGKLRTNFEKVKKEVSGE